MFTDFPSPKVSGAQVSENVTSYKNIWNLWSVNCEQTHESCVINHYDKTMTRMDSNVILALNITNENRESIIPN